MIVAVVLRSWRQYSAVAAGHFVRIPVEVVPYRAVVFAGCWISSRFELQAKPIGTVAPTGCCDDLFDPVIPSTTHAIEISIACFIENVYANASFGRERYNVPCKCIHVALKQFSKEVINFRTSTDPRTFNNCWHVYLRIDAVLFPPSRSFESSDCGILSVKALDSFESDEYKSPHFWNTICPCVGY